MRDLTTVHISQNKLEWREKKYIFQILITVINKT